LRLKYSKKLCRYLLSNSINTTRPAPDDDAAEGSTSHAHGNLRVDETTRPGEDSRGTSRRKWTKEQKKARTGQNKARRFGKVRDDLELCWRVANGAVCDFGDE
jgi:tRNA-dihydrouridine synthase 3